MPIKDALRRFKCKYCGKEFTMFNRSDGELIFYPDNYPWACHGEPELTSHVRMEHKAMYDTVVMFCPEDKIGYCYERTA